MGILKRGTSLSTLGLEPNSVTLVFQPRTTTALVARHSGWLQVGRLASLTEVCGSFSYSIFFFFAEYLRGDVEYDTPCDIYSIGIILYEIYSRKSPYHGEDFREVLRKVCNRRINKRPEIPACMPTKMMELMKRCWSHDVQYRPTAKDLDTTLMDFAPQDAEPQLEEKRKAPTKDMLYELFPKHIADALKRGDKVEPEQHELVTVVFSDIVHFTDLSHELSPLKVSQMLDRLYLAFDQIARKHRVFKASLQPFCILCVLDRHLMRFIVVYLTGGNHW